MHTLVLNDLILYHGVGKWQETLMNFIAKMHTFYEAALFSMHKYTRMFLERSWAKC